MLNHWEMGTPEFSPSKHTCKKLNENRLYTLYGWHQKRMPLIHIQGQQNMPSLYSHGSSDVSCVALVLTLKVPGLFNVHIATSVGKLSKFQSLFFLKMVVKTPWYIQNVSRKLFVKRWTSWSSITSLSLSCSSSSSISAASMFNRCGLVK